MLDRPSPASLAVVPEPPTCRHMGLCVNGGDKLQSGYLGISSGLKQQLNDMSMDADMGKGRDSSSSASAVPSLASCTRM